MAATRQERRKAATRGKLVAAARACFADKGVDATRINEITDAADVGFGSFYSYFESKDAIVAAVVEDTMAAFGREIEVITQDVADPAEVVAVAHRFLVRRAREDPELGWLLVRLELTHSLASRVLRPYARRDLRAGVAAGRFTVDNEGVALTEAGGALLAVVHAGLRGEAPKTAERHHAAGVLRLFGMAPDDAAEVATRPMPPRRP